MTVALGLVAVTVPASGNDSSGTYPRTATVTGTRVNVRPGPSRNHHAFARFARGTKVVVSAKKGEWFQIFLPVDSTCWVHGDYLSPVKTANDDPDAGETMRVLGSQVRVRVSPDTLYTPLGHVQKGELVRATGNRDRTGDWVECFAPLSATAFIHEDFVELGRSIARADVATVVSSFRLGSQRASAEEPESAKVEGDAAGSKVPRIHSSRLHAIHDQYREERGKPVEEWDFQALKQKLVDITRTSEDLGEIENAEVMLGVIVEAERLQADLAEIEKGRKKAREKIVDGKQKERDASKAVHRIPPKGSGDSEFLASGWVVPLGKHSKVGGSHKLMKGNHVLFFISSKKIKLDDYVNKRVGIRGYKTELPQKAGADLVQVTEIKVLSK